MPVFSRKVSLATVNIGPLAYRKEKKQKNRVNLIKK